MVEAIAKKDQPDNGLSGWSGNKKSGMEMPLCIVVEKMTSLPVFHAHGRDRHFPFCYAAQ